MGKQGAVSQHSLHSLCIQKSYQHISRVKPLGFTQIPEHPWLYQEHTDIISTVLTGSVVTVPLTMSAHLSKSSHYLR